MSRVPPAAARWAELSATRAVPRAGAPTERGAAGAQKAAVGRADPGGVLRLADTAAAMAVAAWAGETVAVAMAMAAVAMAGVTRRRRPTSSMCW